MSASFMTAASRKSKDIRGFLREAAGANSLKYKAEKGQRHQIYFPCIEVPGTDENGNPTMERQIVAISGSLHEWVGIDGKYKATICLKDVIRKDEQSGDFLNDGSCPFCDRVSAAWDIYRYREDLERETCGKVGAELEQHMDGLKKTFADERKAKDAREYLYILVVKYHTQPGSNAPVMAQNGLPEYELKVWKISATMLEKMQAQMENSGMEGLEGNEIIRDYPAQDDPRLVVSQSTTAPVFGPTQFISKYPGLLEAIQADVAKFTWDGIEKSFPEWSGMTTAEAKKTTDELFASWDRYQEELKLNPAARYLDTGNPSRSNPALSTAPQLGQAPGAAMPGVPNQQGYAGVQMPGVPGVPGVAPQAAPQVAPQQAAAPQMAPQGMPQGMPQQAAPQQVPPQPAAPQVTPQAPGPNVMGGIPGGIPDANAVFGTGAPAGPGI